MKYSNCFIAPFATQVTLMRVVLTSPCHTTAVMFLWSDMSSSQSAEEAELNRLITGFLDFSELVLDKGRKSAGLTFMSKSGFDVWCLQMFRAFPLETATVLENPGVCKTVTSHDPVSIIQIQITLINFDLHLILSCGYPSDFWSKVNFFAARIFASFPLN